MTKRTIDPIRFSTYFGLGLDQPSLDFVDIPVNTDIPLFVDPYALTVFQSPWTNAASDVLGEYFKRLIALVGKRANSELWELLQHVGEANDAHLGYSIGRPRGSGIGPEKAQRLYDSLSKSEAAKTGVLQDISEADLFIEGVAEDNVSDLSINVLRPLLLEYTTEQCRAYGIPTRPVDGGPCWDPNRGWFRTVAELPMFEKSRLILVPKYLVRRNLSLGSKKFYEYYVLDYLMQEHLRAGDGLVKFLKNGKRRVYKKDLQEKYPFSKDFLARFVSEHEDVYGRFLQDQRKSLTPLTNEQLTEALDGESAGDVPDCKALRAIATGNSTASAFHSFVVSALRSIFYPGLTLFKKELEIDEGRKRIDIVADNVDTKGFFYNLAFQHQIKCPYVFFECKNYSDDLQNPEFDQMIGRFSTHSTKVGFIVCRTISNSDKAWKRCRDALNKGQGHIFVLEDEDICRLLEMASNGDWGSVQDFMRQLMRKLTLGNG